MTQQVPFAGRTKSAGRRAFLKAAGASAFALGAGPALAQSRPPFKIGMTLPLSGPYAVEGKQTEDGARFYLREMGATFAGRSVELIVRDDQGPAGGDLGRRLMQEMIVGSGVDVLAGFSFTPTALSVATLITQAKKPAVIMNAATSIITERSPYFVRVSWTLAQSAATIGDWAAKNGIRRVFSLVSDFAPGHDAETHFKAAFQRGGGEVVGEIRMPITTMEFAPFLQRVRDARPDAVFAFLPGGDSATSFMRATRERGLREAGIRLLVTGDVVEESALQILGETADGTISAHHYSMVHDSPANRRFVEAFRAANGATALVNYRTVAAWDGMAAIRAAVEANDGNSDGDRMMERFKGMQIDSPRGRILIERDTRDITQSVYIRRTERRGNEWVNAEIETYPNVRDPGK